MLQSMCKLLTSLLRLPAAGKPCFFWVPSDLMPMLTQPLTAEALKASNLASLC